MYNTVNKTPYTIALYRNNGDSHKNYILLICLRRISNSIPVKAPQHHQSVYLAACDGTELGHLKTFACACSCCKLQLMLCCRVILLTVLYTDIDIATAILIILIFNILLFLSMYILSKVWFGDV